MPKNTDQVLGHAAEADGIEEYDNPLPDWWLGMFIFCIIWGIGYAIDYHFVSDRSQEGYYLAEMAEAQEMWPQKEAVVSADPAAIAAGEELFKTNCVACHLADLTGSIGPNLVDDEWIHGGTAEDIVRTITEGVPAKGMVTWGPILGPEKIGHLTAYILSKQTGAPAKGAKAKAEVPTDDAPAADAAPTDEGPAGAERAAKDAKAGKAGKAD